MGKIIRGYWDCSYCGNSKIDGLTDICPNCGKQKSGDVRYYMAGTDDEVSEEELNAHKIKKEDCDGNHSDWICPYCNQLNNIRDSECVACGAPKSESRNDYFTVEQKKRQPSQEGLQSQQTYIPIRNESRTGKSDSRIKKLIFGVAAFLITGFLIWGLLPVKVTTTVSGLHWDRTVNVEELQRVTKDGWELPGEAELLYTQEELHHMDEVIDHYETKTRQVATTVLDGYDTEYTYRDNGNGTFTQEEVSTPVYKTVYETETYEEPVYRSVPVYQTKYYYDIDEWIGIADYDSSGDDKNVYWNTEYTLKDKQRDTTRTEEYLVYYTDNKGKEYQKALPFDEWNETDIGDETVITRNRFGTVYSR